MKNTEIRRVLEREILTLRSYKKPLNQSEFDSYFRCLKRLCALNCIYAMKQDRIYTCAYGNIEEFVSEFLKNVSPLINKKDKSVSFNNVLPTSTGVLFSPILTEIALGCILTIFLSVNQTVTLSVFGTKSGVAICASGESIYNSKRTLQCIGHIAKLHSGRSIVSFYKNQHKITLMLPFIPDFKPLKLVPCATELCRLCSI